MPALTSHSRLAADNPKNRAARQGYAADKAVLHIEDVARDLPGYGRRTAETVAAGEVGVTRAQLVALASRSALNLH